MSEQSQLATTAPKVSALAVMAGKFSVEPDKLLATLKATVFKNASNEELLALVVVSNAYGLNPLTKEIYAFPAKGGGIVPVVSVDGWINMANSHPQFDGVDFDFDEKDGKLVSCTAIIHRKDRSRPTRVTEYLEECRRNTEPWKMEHRMLRHKALIQCVRVAFGFSGIYDEDDAAVMGAIDVTERVKIVGGKIGKPGNPLLEASDQVGAPAVPTEAEATVEKPAAKRAVKKTEEPVQQTPTAPAATATPSPTGTVDDLRAELEARCAKAGIDPSDLVLYLASQNFVPKGTTVKGLQAPYINAVFANWEDVAAGVAGAK